ncbi:hypothetical protein [Massilia sp.]|uniref:hypothetical protein n=1 Tax=Massilia sp. TaxID=1882437 RepID=UPI0028976EE0|nr:hypothetical protein [Massilia sp.]
MPSWDNPCATSRRVRRRCEDDVFHAYEAVPNATIVATHMDAINQMTLSRTELKEHGKQHGIQDRVCIREDGKALQL